MIHIKNVTLCSVAWGESYVKKTVDAYNGFSKGISFENTIFFFDRIIDFDNKISIFNLPRYFFDKSTASMSIVGPVHSLEMNPYNQFVIKDVYRFFSTSHLLIFQHDGWIKNPSSWDDRWLEYDYIGAPWLFPGNNWVVGNGGFSLRSHKLCRVLATDPMIRVATPEDWLICVTLRSYLESHHGIRFAPFEVARNFSLEYDLPYTNQFGFHGEWNA